MRLCLAIIVLALLCMCSPSESSEPQPPVNEKFRNLIASGTRFDSVFINGLNQDDSLDYSFIRNLDGSILDNRTADNLRYLVNSFCEIDSIKKAGKYEEYANNLDIGMTADAHAFPVGNISVADKQLLVWGLTVRSYDACPFFTGTFVIGSSVSNGAPTHMPLAKVYYAGDPPSFMEEFLQSTVNGEVLQISSYIKTDDDSYSNGEEITRTEVSVSLRGQPRIIASETDEKDSRPSQ